jgi:hypothetical protein
MPVLQTKPPDQQQLVAYLAEQCHEPIEKVAQLYEQERTKLAKEARITQFLHVFVMRHVREILHKEGIARAAAGLPEASPSLVDATAH